MPGAFQFGAFQFGAFQLEAPVVPARGPAGVATIVFGADDESTVTYEWATDVIVGRRGNEHRIRLADVPGETYGFEVVITDEQLARVQSTIAVNAAVAAVFLVGLAHEGSTVAEASSGPVVMIGDTGFLDWAFPGQRVVIHHADDDAAQGGVIQAVGPSSVTLDTSVDVVPGDVLMPAQACLLEETQPLGLYATGATRWTIRARSVLFGYADDLWTIVGASVTTYDGYPVWEPGSEAGDVVGREISTGVEIVDRGGALSAYGGPSGPFVVRFPRQLRHVVDTPARRQYLKAFMGAVGGRQGAFLLGTGRPDIPFIGDASAGQLDLYSPTGDPNGVDAASWFAASSARNRIRIHLADGTSGLRTITDAGDNLDGTQTLVLDSALAGAIDRVEVMELVRFARDAIEVSWRGSCGYVDEQVIVVEG